MTETKDNVRSALYYPYIHIRSEEWLKATLLCIPAVKRMVPDGYDPEDDPWIVPYSKLRGPYGELVQTVPALSDHPKPAIYDHLKTGHMETYSGTLTAA